MKTGTTRLRAEITEQIKNWEWNLRNLKSQASTAHLTIDETQIENEITFLKSIRRRVMHDN